MGHPNEFLKRSNRSRFKGVQCKANQPGPVGIKRRVVDPLWRTDPYPNIRALSSELYQSARDDLHAYIKVKKFSKTYAKIILAYSDVLLGLDERGKISMKFTHPKSLTTLITDALVAKVIDTVKGATMDAAMEKIWMKHVNVEGDVIAINRFKIFSAILSHAVVLHEIYKDIDAKDLVNHQRGKRRKEAREKKILFCISAIAAGRAQSTFSQQFTNLKISIWKDFYKFEKKNAAWLKWETMEQKLAGTYHAEARIWPARR